MPGNSLSKQIDGIVIQFGAQLRALTGAGDVTHGNLGSTDYWFHADCRRHREGRHLA
jgi:hypothetical protein